MRHAPDPVVIRVERSSIAHQRCRSTNRVTCIMSNRSSIMSIACMIHFSSSQVQLLFRTLADPSHQRTGPVYSPLRGDMATCQSKLIAEEQGDSIRWEKRMQVFYPAILTCSGVPLPAYCSFSPCSRRISPSAPDKSLENPPFCPQQPGGFLFPGMPRVTQ